MKVRFIYSNSETKLKFDDQSKIVMPKAIEERIQFIGGAWWAIQKYAHLKRVGPFNIHPIEALANEILELFEAEYLDEVMKTVKFRYDLKAGEF